MKTKQKLNYRLACLFENKPRTEIEMPSLERAVQEGWKLAGRPTTTQVMILAADGSGIFRLHQHIK
jgi:hypothetical protein